MLKIRAVLYLSASAIMVPATALAQTTPVPDGSAPPSSYDNQTVDDIVVTANKRAQSLDTVPMSITAVSGDQLVSKGVTSVQELTKFTPGLTFVESGTSVPVYSLRGVGFYDTSLGSRPTVSVYVDEAPLPFSIMASGSAFDLERVEVLKGPQGTLFGQNATGGAINYIAAKPKGTFGAGMTASFARFNTADVQGYVTGPLADGVEARLAVRQVLGGDWQKSYTRDAGLGQKDFTQARFLLDIRPTDRLKIAINLNGFRDNGDTQAGQLIAIYPTRPDKIGQFPGVTAYPLAPSNSRAADWGPRNDLRKHNVFYQASFRADYDLTDRIKLTSLTSYSHMRIHQVVDSDGMSLQNSGFDIHGRLSSLSTEARATADFGNLHLIAGGNYADDRALEDDDVTYFYSSLSAALQPFVPNAGGIENYANQKYKTKAVFGNADLDIGRLITLHGGVRYTKVDLDYRACSRAGTADGAAGFNALFAVLRARLGLAPGASIAKGECFSLDARINPGYAQGTFDQDNVSWRAGIDIKPFDRGLIYFNVSRGYKAGSIPNVSATAIDQLAPISQESVLAYEGGFKVSLWDRHVDLSGAGFYYDYSDKQLLGRFLSTPNLFGPLEGLSNVPKSRVIGGEFQINARPVRGLTITLAGTYLDSKITSEFTNYSILGTLQAFRGESFPYTPKFQGLVDADYGFPISARLDGTVGGNYSYRTKTKGGFGQEDVLNIDAYGLLDLRAGVRAHDGSWSAQVFGRNVTNQYYWTNVAKYVDTVRRLSGMPAAYGIQFSHSF